MEKSIAQLYPAMMMASMGLFSTGDTRNEFQKKIEEDYNLEAVIESYCLVKLKKSQLSRKQRQQVTNTVDNLLQMRKLLPHHVNTRMYNLMLTESGSDPKYSIDEFISIRKAEDEMKKVIGEFYIE